MEQLGGIDSAFVFLDGDTTRLHVGGMLIYDPSTAPGGDLTFDQLRAHIAERVAGIPVMRRKLVRVPFDLDNPWWVQQDSVDLEQHISRIALPRPANWRELCRQAARFLSRPVDLRLPPWELCIIEGLDEIDGLPPGAFAMLLKVHHSAIDGVSGMEMASGLHDLGPTPAAPRTHDVPGESPSAAGLIARSLPRLLTKPLRLAYLTAGQVPGLLRSSLEGRPEGEVPSAAVPHTRFNEALGPHRSLGGVELDLKQIKAVRGAVPGLTVNDVLLAVVGGGVRHYLEKVGELPAESLIAMVPISLRADDDRGGGNQLSAMKTSLRTDVADPLERARLIHRETARAKEASGPSGGTNPAAILESIPPGLFSVAGRVISDLELSRRLPMVNTGLTNVPGPTAPIYLCGARAVNVFGYALVAPGFGLINMATSYCGTVYLGFQAGSQMMPDPERYEDCLRLAFDELLEAAHAAGGATSRRPVQG